MQNITKDYNNCSREWRFPSDYIPNDPTTFTTGKQRTFSSLHYFKEPQREGTVAPEVSGFPKEWAIINESERRKALERKKTNSNSAFC